MLKLVGKPPDMGFVHPAKTDLFVSYAHVDDRPLDARTR